MSTIRSRAALAATACVSSAILGLCCLVAAPPALAQVPKQTPQKKKAARPAPGPAPAAAPGERLKVLKGFKVELVYSVPRETEGSWVSLTTAPKGRLIASDQYGKLFQITPSPIGQPASATKVEPINVDIGEAQGLLWAFDSLYVVVNQGGKYPSGLYRVRDTDGDDKLDKVELLRKLEGGGEHGPHGVVLGPDAKSLYIVAGNATRVPELAGSLVPRVWGEDNLLPRMTDGNGFMADEKAPGGFVCRVDPDGKDWTLVSMGYRNPYDIAFNRAGELFTYDSDMEWDMNTPWYRPTRICNVVSGSDFGYRNGAGKWPTYYFDSLPPVVNIGPGSPTGVTFGYDAKFPAKYQEAFYICDWSYGKLYALHMKPKGASYSAEIEEFVTGTPLPLTDIIVHPGDGALYFAVGGRRTGSALYRVVYDGNEPTAPATPDDSGSTARAERHKLEAFHGHADPNALAFAWPYLSNPDRFLRYAARVAIEFQPAETWRDKALAETNPQAALEALLALTQVSAPDPAHRRPTDPAPSPEVKAQILAALDRLGWDGLSVPQRLDLLRVYAVVFNRMGKPAAAETARLVARFDAHFPSKIKEMNVDLCNLLVYLDAPDVAAKTLPLLASAPTQEEQIDFARTLRTLKSGWTPELRKAYFSWFLKSSGFKGGSSFGKFLLNIKRDAVAGLSESERNELRPILEAQPSTAIASAAPARLQVKTWTLDELVPLAESGLRTKRDFDRGRSLFGAAQCAACHRFDNDGGAAGPDLTGVSGRFSPRDLLESIVLPSKVISDQYGAIMVQTSDGRTVVGRIMNLNGDTMMINTNMLDPNAQVSIDRKKIEETRSSPLSLMPEGLLNTLDREEILDLLAFLLSRGDRDNAMFR
jgi:putative heme-binding domain-containing protein